jgi:protein-tyrosine phosphatase
MSSSHGTANHRDVGEALGLWMEPSPIPSGRLLRGGKFDTLTTASELGNPRTILNLRQGPDPRHLPDVAYVHVPAENQVENYDTSLREVRAWLAKAINVLANPTTAWPVYVHCTSGRDRTGVVVAAVLLLLGVPRDVIIEEFLLSDGAERASIVAALEGIARAQATLGVDVGRLRTAVLGPSVAGT